MALIVEGGGEWDGAFLLRRAARKKKCFLLRGAVHKTVLKVIGPKRPLDRGTAKLSRPPSVINGSGRRVHASWRQCYGTGGSGPRRRH